MGKKEKLFKINKEASAKISEIKAILAALADLEQGCYPANTLIDIAKRKSMSVLYNIEKNRKILKILD
ncbi:MAG: hypothetical protein PHX18_04285 [Candidatus Gastranaerophilales bacterium]|nr:hypothetical protein [Candidatus Gastranaerophilales bacterium]